MNDFIASLTPNFFNRAFNYTGSIGDFRFRFLHEGKDVIHAAAYSKLCYEKADDVVEQDFPWTEEGVEELKQWLEEHYQQVLNR